MPPARRRCRIGRRSVADPIGDDTVLQAYPTGYQISYMNSTQGIWETLVRVYYDKNTAEYSWF